MAQSPFLNPHYYNEKQNTRTTSAASIIVSSSRKEVNTRRVVLRSGSASCRVPCFKIGTPAECTGVPVTLAVTTLNGERLKFTTAHHGGCLVVEHDLGHPILVVAFFMWRWRVVVIMQKTGQTVGSNQMYIYPYLWKQKRLLCALPVRTLQKGSYKFHHMVVVEKPQL